jgi:plasmid maintenance system antidote protein VapI
MVNNKKVKKNVNGNEGDFHKKLPPIHPGEILRERLLIPHDISPQELATALKVPKEQIK